MEASFTFHIFELPSLITDLKFKISVLQGVKDGKSYITKIIFKVREEILFIKHLII